MGIYRRMGVGRRPFFMRIAFAEAIFAVIGFFTFAKFIFGSSKEASISYLGSAGSSYTDSGRHRHAKTWEERPTILTQAQCRREYPLLYKPIEEAVARGEFDFHRGPDQYSGLVTARIKNNRLYIIANSDSYNTKANVMQRMATLHQLHKALITSQERLPDTVFCFTPIDYPKNNSWVYSKWYDQNEILNYWPVPHFGHWSWPVRYIGPVPDVQDKVKEIEATMPFEEKIDKIFWRGTLAFNPLQNSNLRGNLLRAAEDKEWADVGTLNWKTHENAQNIVQIPEICKYKYVAYTEGITYSGRLPFHLLCESVIITVPINYLMHSTHLMKPLFAWELGFQSTKKMAEYGKRRMEKAWPRSFGPGEANTVFVSPDWSDLEETVLWLRDNPQIAKGIARRQKEIFVDQGYLSESAEMCYWRELIRGWNKVAIPVGEGWDELGLPWETFALRGSTEWDSSS